MSIENELYDKGYHDGYIHGQQSVARKYEQTSRNQELIIDDLQRRYQYLLENFGNFLAYHINPAPVVVRGKQ